MNNTICASTDFDDDDDDDERNLPKVVPSVVFKTRVRDESIEGPNPYRWEDVTTFDLFAGKRVVLFSLPGAFTPTCSTYQLPGFEEKFSEFKALGIKDIYCISVNDAFVMNAWAKQQKIKKIKVIPDGSCEFTSHMHMAVGKDNLGFGMRSWRYACVVNNGKIEKWFIEPGKCWNNAKITDNNQQIGFYQRYIRDLNKEIEGLREQSNKIETEAEEDPYGETAPENILNWLRVNS